MLIESLYETKGYGTRKLLQHCEYKKLTYRRDSARWRSYKVIQGH